MEQDRKDKWKDISWQSFWFDNDMQELVWLIQMLGKDDTALYAYDHLLNIDSQNILTGSPTPSVDDQLHEMVWKAYTWVLASYELIRTINQRLRTSDPDAEITSKSQRLKSDFARIRIPMAKFEPAGKHSKTDYKFPQGCTQPGRGLCWAVADGVVISRMELSDSLINFFLELKNYRKE